MNIEEIKEILSKITFAPSNLDMGWEWDIKSTKIFDQNDITIEKGFSIRTTFLRPDSNTGEIEKGYGRWMYVPETISTDGLVKTGWLCAELIIKHELMEAFLYQQTRIFDPHKSLKDLSYHGRTVDINIETPISEEIEEESKVKYDITKRTLREGSKITNTKPGPTTSKPEINPAPQKPVDVIDIEEDIPERGITITNVEEIDKEPKEKMDKIIHSQNIDNHREEITDYLEEKFKNTTLDNGIPKYITQNGINIFHNIETGGVYMANSGGQVVDHRGGEDINRYTLSDVKDMLKNIPETKKETSDPSDINQMIFNAGYINGEPQTEDGSSYWIFSNPTKKHRFVVHSELEKSIVLINQNKEVLKSFEGDEYTSENIKTIL